MNLQPNPADADAQSANSRTANEARDSPAREFARLWSLACVDCGATYGPLEIRYRCECGGTLEIAHRWEQLPQLRAVFDQRRLSGDVVDRSGVWRYRELVLPLPDDAIVTRGEGNTNLYESPAVSAYCQLDHLRLKHEGENPTGSFKDRGMTTAMSMAKLLGVRAVACASTGNTSASLASYAAVAGIPAMVFVPAERVSSGKLSQALAYGASTLLIDGGFDDGMRLVQQVCRKESIYLVNSINPFRIEGQKAIAFELLHQLDWHVPDWIVLPGGNLGNCSAIAKALIELQQLGLIQRLPRLAVVQARGANPLVQAFARGIDVTPLEHVETLATAIRIGNPVSWKKCVRGLRACDGVATDIDDQAIMDAKAVVDSSGIGAEPASCATVAGIRRLVAEGTIQPTDSVCGILTGHLLKDADAVRDYHAGAMKGIVSARANRHIEIGGSLADIRQHIEKIVSR